MLRKKKNWMLTALLVGAVSLSACGEDAAKEELEENDDNKAEAKVDDEATASESESETEAAETEAAKEGEKNDLWTYYDDVTWSDDFNGLKSEIQKVVVTEKAPTMEDETAEESAVGVKFKLENTTEGKFTTYPDQATLVTSTGEQIDMPDMFMSDNIGGEIDKGVIKEGAIIWYLERGKAKEIEWIKMSWDARKGAEDNMEMDKRKDYEIELDLSGE
ncbi:hypothetical protein [Thalassobacillus sp. CUG 92003]|uniref:hypothetical protein n=1 Tax=Thalassobacillus sp. CUG 92003 TaxID=2736641 RepID=UPI0015E77F6A|nr:hypothetical protein [Thalassobacillus sp. CUG 92003]